MIPRNCQLCGWRDFVAHTDYEGRIVRACGVCLEPPDVPPDFDYEPVEVVEVERGWVRNAVGHFQSAGGARFKRVATVLRAFGEATQGQIVEACGVTDCDSKEYDAYGAVLYRAVKRGDLVAEGKRNTGRVYRLAVAS